MRLFCVCVKHQKVFCLLCERGLRRYKRLLYILHKERDMNRHSELWKSCIYSISIYQFIVFVTPSSNHILIIFHNNIFQFLTERTRLLNDLANLHSILVFRDRKPSFFWGPFLLLMLISFNKSSHCEKTKLFLYKYQDNISNWDDEWYWK